MAPHKITLSTVFAGQNVGRQGNESQGVRQQLKCNPHQRDHAPIMPCVRPRWFARLQPCDFARIT
jgi:hypothetical protein